VKAATSVQAGPCGPAEAGPAPAGPGWQPADPGVPAGPGRRAGLAAKRALDVLGALAGLAVLGVPMLVLAGCLRRQLGGPALFRQVRVTGPGRHAVILKLRTLRGGADPDTCWVPSRAESTALGWLLRATHLDELPQLINVLRGDLSLVGPRPERPHFARRFAAEIPGYADRTRMKAGLTGWAQVHGLNGDTSVADRAALDNAYIDTWSLRLDLVILARTAWLAATDLARHLRSAPGRAVPAAPVPAIAVPAGPRAALGVPSFVPGQGGQP
jgi:lipopolysaccharide/colanic/teichoic acid biosynthesis glycosyltransferase